MKWQKDIAILFHFRWGRVCRLQWWVISILMAPLWFAADMVRTKEWRVEDTTELVIVLATIPLLWISLAVGAKRYHDMDKSGWRQLLGVILFVLRSRQVVQLSTKILAPARNPRILIPNTR